MKTDANHRPCSSRTDTQAEIDLVCELAKRAGAFDAVPCYHWSMGGKGSVDLAWAVREAANKGSRFQFLYDVQVRPRSQGDAPAAKPMVKETHIATVFYCILISHFSPPVEFLGHAW